MSDSNLRLWNQVCTTNPAHCKEASISGQKRTTVKAVYQNEKATEIFGIQGQEWGIKPETERYERFTIGDEVMLQYTAVMFYNFEGKTGELPIAAAIMEVVIRKKGKPDAYIKIDEEAIKKVRTDAKTKALSELGFNADIFKGYYDSQGYAEYASSVHQEVEQEKVEEKTISEAEEYAEWKKKALEIYSCLNTNKAIETTFTKHIRKASKIGDNKAIKEFEAAKTKRQEELKNV
jgi:hypothetical protein